MKLVFIFVWLLLPSITFGQLFPKLPEFRGNIEKVTEKRYGKELNPTKNDSAVFKPGKYSGWKYTYFFDENSKLKNRTNSFQNKVLTKYSYQRNKMGDRIIEREIIEKDDRGHSGDYVEYENITDSDGRITKVNFWAVAQQKNTRELFLIEMNAEYRQGKLISFTRHNVGEAGNMDTGEKCELFYDSADRLIQIERKDIESNLTTKVSYTLNPKGFLDHYSVDYLVGLSEYGKENQIHEIYFDYDRQGNWTRMYRKGEDKMQLEAKRTIRYR